MAPPAKSRKGKKEWRKNIDASEVEAYLEDATYTARRGPAPAELADAALFFVDKSADADGAAAVAEGRRPAKRRREEAAARPLRAEAIIAEAHKAKPVAMAPPPRKPAAGAGAGAVAGGPGKGGKGGGKDGKDAGALVPSAVAAGGVAKRSGGGGKQAAGGKQRAVGPLRDLWAGEDFGAAPGPGSGAAAAAAASGAAGARRRGKGKGKDAAAAAAAPSLRSMGPSAAPLRGSPPPRRVAAVVVDVPGCSFNPDPEQHQDALALLVAAEHTRALRAELLPAAPPGEVEGGGGEGPADELAELQVEEEADSDDEEGAQRRRTAAAAADAAAADPAAIPLEEGEEEEEAAGGGGGGAGAAAAARRRAEKKNKKDRNREARRKAEAAAVEERQRLRAQRRQLAALEQVAAEVEAEAAEQEALRQRRASLRAERAAVAPPRLGKLRFEAPALQVATSDQAEGGSLRRVVPCALLAGERFKSLQQRGLVEPRRPQPHKEKRRKVPYEKGARAERSAAASAVVREMGRVNKKARRAAKAADAAAGEDGAW